MENVPPLSLHLDELNSEVLLEIMDKMDLENLLSLVPKQIQDFVN